MADSTVSDVSKTFKIAGCDVAFPRQPYGVQLVFMAKLIAAIDSSRNALLEAPTGCGKTLAILCGALAWQSKIKDSQGIDELANHTPCTASDMTQGTQQTAQFVTQHGVKQDPNSVDAGSLPVTQDHYAETGSDNSPSVPRIYYCTRTHSQIAQVVKELKGIGYDPRMAYLGSRSHYCIHHKVSKAENMSVDEACEKQRESANSCKYFKGVGKGIPAAMAEFTSKVYDIEDLAEFGRNNNACPYYISRQLMDTAEVVFCPYNYLIDPGIRKASGIGLNGAVVIFDEAHNIEDVAREAGSIDVSKQDLEDALADTIKPAQSSEDSDISEKFLQVQGALTKIQAWLEMTSNDEVEVRKVQPDRYEGVWDGSDVRIYVLGMCMSWSVAAGWLREPSAMEQPMRCFEQVPRLLSRYI